MSWFILPDWSILHHLSLLLHLLCVSLPSVFSHLIVFHLLFHLWDIISWPIWFMSSVLSLPSGTREGGQKTQKTTTSFWFLWFCVMDAWGTYLKNKINPGTCITVTSTNNIWSAGYEADSNLKLLMIFPFSLNPALFLSVSFSLTPSVRQLPNRSTVMMKNTSVPNHLLFKNIQSHISTADSLYSPTKRNFVMRSLIAHRHLARMLSPWSLITAQQMPYHACLWASSLKALFSSQSNIVSVSEFAFVTEGQACYVRVLGPKCQGGSG